jgi:hypothetical protein
MQTPGIPESPPPTPSQSPPPGRHRRAEPFVGRHRRPDPSTVRWRARGSAAAALLLLAGAAPASVADPPATQALPEDPVAAPVRPAEALAERERAADPPSRSLPRDTPLRDRPVPTPRGAEPGTKPRPKPPPAPEPPPEESAEPADPAKPAENRPAETAETAENKPAENKPAEERKPDRARNQRESGPPAPIAGLNRRQMAHAATIVRVGQEMGLPERAYVVALATAMQESTLRVLASTAVPGSFDHPHDGVGSDHDSVGLFQQRPSMGWGTVAECMDPERSARAFYRALRRVQGWQNMPVTVAAQTVQVSAYPDHYAKHEWLARKLVAALS